MNRYIETTREAAPKVCEEMGRRGYALLSLRPTSFDKIEIGFTKDGAWTKKVKDLSAANVEILEAFFEVP